MNYPFFNVFKGFTIFLWQINLPFIKKKYVFTSKSEFLNNFLGISIFLLKTWTERCSVLFFCLKLHKLPYLSLFIGFNNILKKKPFSCNVKCNTFHWKKYIFLLEKGFISVFSLNKKLIYFLLFPSFSFKIWKWKEKNTEKSFFLKKYIFFSLKWLVLHFM